MIGGRWRRPRLAGAVRHGGIERGTNVCRRRGVQVGSVQAEGIQRGEANRVKIDGSGKLAHGRKAASVRRRSCSDERRQCPRK
jgi:hypothetical protein